MIGIQYNNNNFKFMYYYKICVLKFNSITF